MQRTARLAATLAIAALAGCNLPHGAPVSGTILSEAADPAADLALYPVTRASLPALARWPALGAPAGAGWPLGGPGSGPLRIRPGDRLDLAIWDNSDSSLLANPQQKVVAMQGLLVSPEGTIFVPYANTVQVAGLTIEEARARIQEAVGPIVNEGQVQLGMAAGRANSVDVISGVMKPGPVPMPEGGLTVLSVLAAGGGVPPALRNPQVRLTRQGRLHTISLARLYADPKLDIALRGGDKLVVVEDDRSFMALGAAGHEAQMFFPKDSLTALEAVSLIGGVNDMRADLKGVLVLRRYPPAAIRGDGAGPSKDRMVFVMDLASADGIFSAGQFAIQPGDLVLVTESPVTSTQTVFGLIGNALGVAQRVSAF